MATDPTPRRVMHGWTNGLLGVVIFSGSLPATHLADAAFNPLFLTGARASIAGIFGLSLSLLLRQKPPARGDIPALLRVAAGIVVGFPYLTALALQFMPTARAIAYIGLLPLATAVCGVWRGGERPRPGFWLFSGAGSLLILGYMAAKGFGAPSPGDLLMLAAIAVCGLGYAEGAKLSARLGGWQVVVWALVLALPLMIGLTLLGLPVAWPRASAQAWAGLAYLAIFSSLIGFLFWYRGLAQGGIAAVGQLQLLQPFFGLMLAAVLLHERLRPSLIGLTAATALCVAAARRFANPQAKPAKSSLESAMPHAIYTSLEDTKSG